MPREFDPNQDWRKRIDRDMETQNIPQHEAIRRCAEELLSSQHETQRQDLFQKQQEELKNARQDHIPEIKTRHDDEEKQLEDDLHLDLTRQIDLITDEYLNLTNHLDPDRDRIAREQERAKEIRRQMAEREKTRERETGRDAR